MAEITIVRNHQAPVSPADKDTALRVLFGHIDGLGEKGRKQWRRFINGLLKLEPGEMATIQTHRERVGWYHRKHMALESQVFESQERFEEFEAFRVWLKVGAGHCDWVPGPKGAVVPIPRSISYSKLGQDEMEAFHDAAIAFLRTEHAQKVLWPHQPAAMRSEALEELLASFETFGGQR